MVKWTNNQIKVLSIVSFFTFVCVAVSQDLTIENFTIPICANGNGEDYLNFYESFNGEYNNCNYRVVFATLFCSW